MDNVMGPGLYKMDCMEAMKQFPDGFCAPRGARKGDEGSMEELMALLRTIAGGIQDDEARHAAMESVEDFGKALNRKPAEAQAPAEAEGEDAEIRAVEAYRERIRSSMADILEEIAIKTVSSDVEEIRKLAEAACGSVTALHLAGLLGKG